MSKQQNMKEKIILDTLKRNWNMKASNGYKFIVQKFGKIPDRELLLNIAKCIGRTLNIPIEREAQRRKLFLIKWFDDHVDNFQSFQVSVSHENRVILTTIKKNSILMIKNLFFKF